MARTISPASCKGQRDGSVMPAYPGREPIPPDHRTGRTGDVALAEQERRRTRPPLGSGYDRVDPVMPHRPIVPAGAPGELRLDAKADDLIPEYPLLAA